MSLTSKPHLGLDPEFGARDPKSDFDISTFKTDGFSDFELDLTLLSNPPSPVPSTSEHSINMAIIPKRSPSIKSLALPFFSSSSSHTNERAPSPSPKLDAIRSDTRGSWPLVKYVGRGTPIDQSRRIEWGVGSDELGVLFPSSSISGVGIAGRGSSLDSGVGVGARPSYVDWHTTPLHLNNSRANSPEPEPAQRFIEALPETSRLRITALEEPEDPDEWNGVMQAVFGSDGEKEQNGSAVRGEDEREKKKGKEKEKEKEKEKQLETSLALVPVSRSSQRSALDAVLKALDEDVDLGLGFGGSGKEEIGNGSITGNGGMKFPSLGTGARRASVSGSGRETPSVYSTAESVVDRRNGAEERRSSGEEVVVEEQREVVKHEHDQESQRTLVEETG
ncbi:hypothetical protein VNI00_008133 [Paramarasmius palmivorus]|uniref:Uncharacterized protein n=1 Tax=Paramarasmius palmivorus TaxID=297713 RepID=A0AAW0CV76_9AGAR